MICLVCVYYHITLCKKERNHELISCLCLIHHVRWPWSSNHCTKTKSKQWKSEQRIRIKTSVADFHRKRTDGRKKSTNVQSSVPLLPSHRVTVGLYSHVLRCFRVMQHHLRLDRFTALFLSSDWLVTCMRLEVQRHVMMRADVQCSSSVVGSPLTVGLRWSLVWLLSIPPFAEPTWIPWILWMSGFYYET